jgi:hypothetical protein
MLVWVVMNRQQPHQSHKSCPVRTSSSSPVQLSDLWTFRRFDLSATYPLYFHILANSFALTKNSTLFLSSVSKLFVKNHPGWG